MSEITARRVLQGGGLLGAAVSRRITVDAAAPILVLAGDSPAAMRRLTETLRADGATETGADGAGPGPWLPVHGELDRIVIGPLVRPGRPGCDRCVELRRAGAREDAAEEGVLRARHGRRLEQTVSPLLTPLTAQLAADLAARELAAARDGAGAAVTEHAVIMIRLAPLEVTVHSFLPDPDCPQCGGLPPDRADLAVLPRVPRPKPDPGVQRVRDLRAQSSALDAAFVDDEVGVVKNVRARGLHMFPFVSSVTGPPESVDGGYGRAYDFAGARTTAVAEALERLGGGRPGGRRTVVFGSYRDLRDSALDPANVGAHEPRRYEEPDFPCQPYRADLELPWVWGYSLTRECPVLVPESLAYYRVHRHEQQHQKPFVSEISNGCALGGCVEEAALHGLLELAERDAFLLSWYARKPAPAVDLADARDRRVALMAERISDRTGYRIEVFDITAEQGVPSFWAMAIDDRADQDRPKALCAAGSGLDPERGIAGALYELSTAVEAYLLGYPDKREQAARMRADSEAVRQMDDHALLYCDRQAFERFDFLLGPDGRGRLGRRALGELRDQYRWPQHEDLRADLDELVARYAEDGLEVLIVDQTTPVHRTGGLSCVKVLVPGLLPMTFGHRLRRVQDLPRVHEAARLLGGDGLNPYPHPFP